jgi:ribonucleotide reductase alpha subunit
MATTESNTVYSADEMRVTKRDGKIEDVSFDKILNRIKKLAVESNIKLNFTSLAMKVIDQLYDCISTAKIDELSAEQCASLASTHPDYNILAGRIVVSNHHKNTTELFSEVMSNLYHYIDKHQLQSPLVSTELYEFVKANSNELDTLCDYNRDYLIDYFGFKTLERAYLMRLNRVIVERPQHMWLRVAIGIHCGNMERIKETYELMSLKYFTHATPTLFNAGTPHPQLSSCYLLSMEKDSIEGIYNTLKDCALISKWAGGIGLHIHNVRASGSHIRGTNGSSNGIVPMLRVFNNTAKYVDQGGGKRNGSFAIYLEPWHADIEVFLQMRKNHGDEELKARDLFYALWIPDLFMERMKADQHWTLMCPDECPGLADVYGAEFKQLYESYEAEGKGRKSFPARKLWLQILDAQMETGTPYICYKDAANVKSNQKNIGTIKSSNLCVAGETLVLTKEGHRNIRELVGKPVEVWNGHEWSEVKVFQTGGKDTPVITVTVKPGTNTSELVSLRCTPKHQFYVYNEHGVAIPVDAANLTIGSELMDLSLDGTQWANQGYIGAKVVSITDYDEMCETFCFTEPKRHMGVFNGILTGQCTEIIEYSDDKETAVCNLASIALPAFVNIESKTFNYEKLHSVTRSVTYNLNRVIDINYYPTPKTLRSNLRHRPIGLGVQGLADTFILLGLPFYSDEAKEINKLIFETIYHAALVESNQIAIDRYHKIVSTTRIETTDLFNEYEYPIYKNESNTINTWAGAYSTFVGSPTSHGILQYDMWNVQPTLGRYDWDTLKQSIVKHGIRNSLLVAPMPTASTSQILGYNECIEPITSNIYSRRTLAGEFILANKYLMYDLIALGLWNDKIKNGIIANNGSIQTIDVIPEHIRNKYKTVWEMPMRHLIDMAADRGAFICQSQSLNLWLEDPNYNTLSSMHMYSWTKGLKTGIYYLRRRAKHQAQQFTVEPEKKEQTQTDTDHEICEMCSA